MQYIAQSHPQEKFINNYTPIWTLLSSNSSQTLGFHFFLGYRTLRKKTRLEAKASFWLVKKKLK